MPTPMSLYWMPLTDVVPLAPELPRQDESLDHYPVPLLRCTSQGVIQDVSQPTALLFGVTVHQIVGMPLLEMVAAGHRSELRALLQGRSMETRVWMHLGAGPQRYLSLRASREPNGIWLLSLSDKTAEYTTQQALLVQRTLLEMTTERAPLGMLLFDADEKVMQLNGPLRALLGLSARRSYRDITVEHFFSGTPTPEAAWQKVTGGHVLNPVTFVAPQEDNEERLLELQGGPIFTPDGDRVGGVFFLRDVSEEVRNLSLRRDQSRFQRAAEALRELVQTSPSRQPFIREALRILGQVVSADRLLFYVPGYDSPDEWSLAGHWSNADFPLPRARLTWRADVGEALRPGQFVAFPRAGSPADQKSLGLFEGGEAEGMLVFQKQNTPWDDASAALWPMVHHLVALFESILEGLAVKDRQATTLEVVRDAVFQASYSDQGQRRYLFASSHLEKLFGAPVAEVLHGHRGWEARLFAAEDEQAFAAHEQRLKAGQPSEARFRVRDETHSAGFRWFSEWALPLPAPYGGALLQIMGSLREEPQSFVSTLLPAAAPATPPPSDNASFVYTLSHELRTPLGKIKGYSELLHQELSSLGTSPSSRLGEFSEVIATQAAHALELLQKFFDMRNDNLNVAVKPIALNDHVLAVVESFAPQVNEKGIALEILLDPTNPLGVCDARRLRQILDELMENALKFTDEGQITIRSGHLNGEAWVEVQDTGIGVEEDVLPHIFSPFFQADQRLNRNYGGTGIGLAHVKKLVESMKGRISVESRVDVGSTFRVIFPEGH